MGRVTWGTAIVATWSAIGGCGDARVVAPPVPVPVASTSATASASAAPPDYVYPDDGPIPQLRAGSMPPIDVTDPIAAHVTARQVGDMETLLVEVPLSDEQATRLEDGDRQIVVDVARAASDPHAYAFVVRGSNVDPPNASALYVWARRAASAAGTPLHGDLYLPLRRNVYVAGSGVGWRAGGRATQPGLHLRFTVDDVRATASDPKVVGQWITALADHFEPPPWGRSHRGPWESFAAAKLRAMAPKKAATPVPAPSTMRFPPPTPPAATHVDLARFMETTTGAASIQETLQHERALVLAAAKTKQTTPVSSLKGPTLSPLPWKTMLARIKGAPPIEPLAIATPAEFYFARANDFAALLRVVDRAATWGTPLASLMNEASEDRDVFARYEAQLGVRRGPLTERLGTTAIADMAIVGSDPYLIEGSDVTLVFRARSGSARGLLDAALAGTLTSYEQAHGKITNDKRTHEGVDVAIARSADGVVRQQRATVGEIEILSNSAGAIDRVIEAALGKRPRLSDQADFQYMLARDATTRADVLAYVSDRFLSEVIGPKQKILELRRQIALAELATPGFAALLYGHMYGKSPTSIADLTRAKLFDASELSHVGGGAITWKPGIAARSTWGTAAALTPLVDLPQVDKVSDAEKAAYAEFSSTYQSAWRHYVDPISIRIATDPARLAIDVRELPLIDNSDYKELAGFVGDTRIDPGKAPAGMRTVFAIGADSPLRQELDQETRGLFKKTDLSFDWIADWAAIGVLDRSSLATSAMTLLDDELPQVPQKETRRSGRDEKLGMFAKLPIYFAVGVRNPAAAVAALAAIRSFVEETAPGMVSWIDTGNHRGATIVRVGINEEKESFFGAMFEGVEVYYAIAGGALVAAPSEVVLRRVIDERLDGKSVKGLGDQPSGSQLTFDLGGDPNGALWTTMTWMLETATLDDGTRGGRGTGDALFRGAPDRAGDAAAMRALAIAYFGAMPTTPDGGVYTMSPDGLRDPLRGTSFAPVWPAIPIDGSPVARVVKSLSAVRTDMGFDEEPGSTQTAQLRSMHARAVFDLR